MSAQHTVTLTVFSRNRDKKVYPDASKYTLDLPHAVPRVRQVMLSAIEFSSVQRNIESPGTPFPFGEGVDLSSQQYCEEPGQFNYHHELILVQGETRTKIDLPPSRNTVTASGSSAVITATPHGLAAAFCAGIAVHMVDIGCPLAITPETVQIIDENSFSFTGTPCVPAADMVGATLHAAPLLQIDIVDMLQKNNLFRCAGYAVGVTDTGGLRFTHSDDFTLITGLSTAHALGLSMAACGAAPYRGAARRDADGSDEWYLEGDTPTAGTFVAQVPANPHQSYSNIGALTTAVTTAMGGFVLASSTTHRFCARTFNGVPRVVTLKPGQYTPERLAAAVQRALNGMTTNDTEDSYVVTFEATGDKGRFSIGNTRCPFSLELQVNPNVTNAAASSPLPATHFLRALMGFQGRQYTGQRCYQGEPVALLAAAAPPPPGGCPATRRAHPRFKYDTHLIDDADLPSHRVRLCAERRYIGEACEKCLAGQATVHDDIVKVTHTPSTTLTITSTNVIMGVQPGDVIAIGLPGCPECPLVGTVASNEMVANNSVATVTLLTKAMQDKAGAAFQSGQETCFARVWLFDTPRFELPLYPAVSRYNHALRMLGWEHAYHGGCYCYDTVQCWTLTPHPFIIVNIGTPELSAPYKYYGGTGKAVPITTTLSLSGTYRAFQETYDFKTSGSRRVGQITVELLNPDLTPYRVCDHYITLAFVCEGDRAVLACE